MVIITADKSIFPEDPKNNVPLKHSNAAWKFIPNSITDENVSLECSSTVMESNPNCFVTNEVSNVRNTYVWRNRSHLESDGEQFLGVQDNKLQDDTENFKPQVFEISTTAAAHDGNVILKKPGRSELEETSHLPIRTGRNIYGDYSYADLIEMAINNSPTQKLTVDQIYKWIIANVPDINERTNGEASWKNSVRHSLSYKKHFIRIHTDGLFWWTIDYNEKTKIAGRQRAYSMDSKQLEAARQRVHYQKLTPIPSQDLLPTESYETPPFDDNENREIKSKFPSGFKKKVQRCVQKLKNAMTSKLNNPHNLRRTKSLRDGRNACRYAVPSCSYTHTEHNAYQQLYSNNIEHQIRSGAHTLKQTFNNSLAECEYTTYCNEQETQVNSYDRSQTNQVSYDRNINICRYPTTTNEHTPNSFIDNNSQQLYNNYFNDVYDNSNQILPINQPFRERKNTSSSTSSDYLQEWQYFTGEQTQFENQDHEVISQTYESEHLNVLADKLETNITLQPTNDVAEDTDWYSLHSNRYYPPN